MAVTLVGLTSTSPVTSGQKLRATWNVVTLFGISVVDAPSQALLLQKKLPSLGFVAISSPSAILGDRVVVFDIRLSAMWGGKIVADILRPLDSPLNALKLARLATYSVTSPLDQTQQQDAARRDGNDAAAAAGLLPKVGGFFGDLLKNLATGAGVIVGIAVVVGAVYLYQQRRR